MAYVGNPLINSNIIVDKFDAAGTTFSLSRAPGSANAILVLVGSVPQNPGVAYSVSGQTLTLTESVAAVASGGPGIEVYHLAAAGVAGVPSDGSVTPAKLSAGGPSWDSSGNASVLSLLATGSGTAASAALKVQSSNTGLFAPSANALGLATNGVERQRISNAGDFSRVIPGGSVLYPEFACRAWVNFNGTGTVAIRGSGNVSSITDVGTGLYSVNFASAMPDVNYAVSLGARRVGTSSEGHFGLISATDASRAGVYSTTAFDVYTAQSGTGMIDYDIVCASVFR